MGVQCAILLLLGVRPNSGWVRWRSRANNCAQRGRLPKRCGSTTPTYPMSSRAAPQTTRWGLRPLPYPAVNTRSTARTGRKSIGKFASYGWLAIYNEDIAHLFQRVSVGTPVVVTR